jgi:ketol-acid reductoisomerase
LTRVLRDRDADPSLLEGVKIGVVGFGNQGQAQALCLRDSGLDVLVFVRRGGPSEPRARAHRFEPRRPDEIHGCGVIALLVPDEAQPEVVETLVRPYAPAGAMIVFAHGFALRHGGAVVREDLDSVLVGPLGPGALLRSRYEAGSGLAGLFAVVRDATGHARQRALAYSAALGLTRAGLLPTTLDEEVVSDLFAEQAVMCGGVVELVRAAWETLVADGISEEIAYYSCVQELKQILDLVHAEGPAGMRARTSGTAQYGGLTRGPRLVGDAVREELRRVLDEVRSGRFAAEWIEEHTRGGARLEALRDAEASHPMETAGRRVRRTLGGAPAEGVDSPGPET